MKFLSTIFGFLSLISFFLAIIITMLSVQNPWLGTTVWALTSIFCLAWIFLNRTIVLAFLTKKSTRTRANLSFAVFLVVGILLFINILAKEYSWRKDITKAGLNTLSPQTNKLLHELPVNVKFNYFSRMQDKEKADAFLKLYAHESKKFKYEIIDPNRQPTLAQALGITKIDTGVITAEGSNKQIKIEGTAEEKLTNGLIKLLKTKSETIYFTVGHGEHSISDTTNADAYGFLKEALEKEGYFVKELNLFTEGKIPEDASILILAGAKSTFFPKELEILVNWLKAGGNALFALDLDIKQESLAAGSRQLAELLRVYGITTMDKMLVDPTSKAANVEPQVLMGFAEKKHPITADFPTSSAGLVANFLFPLTTYFQFSEKPEQKISSLVKSSSSAWAGEWKELKSGVARYHEGKDPKGKMDMALAIEGSQSKNGKDRLVLFATSSLATNGVFRIASNRDLFLNSIAWLGSQEQYISIRAKTEEDTDRVSINVNLLNTVLILTEIVVPFLIIAYGIWIWRRRSKQ